MTDWYKNERIIVAEMNRVLNTEGYEDFYEFMHKNFTDDMYIVNEGSVMEMAFFYTGGSLIAVFPQPTHEGEIGYDRAISEFIEDDGFVYIPEDTFYEGNEYAFSWYSAWNFDGIFKTMCKVNEYLKNFREKHKNA